MKGAVLVRMSTDLKDWIDAMAKEKNISTPEYIRALISKERDLLTRPKINPFKKEERKVVNA